MWKFPLKNMKYVGKTIDSYSFLDLSENEVELPLYPHVGSFGIRRRHDIHKGVDLYANIGSEVIAVEDGIIVDICPFTGPKAGFPWWLDTEGVYIKGSSGIVVYGEIKANKNLKIGDFVKQGDLIGTVLRVLIEDRGRPTSMLHLELHEHNHIHCNQWELKKEKPHGILDPSVYLDITDKEEISSRQVKINILSKEFIFVLVVAVLLASSYIYAVQSRTWLSLGILISMMVMTILFFSPILDIFEWKIWKIFDRYKQNKDIKKNKK